MIGTNAPRNSAGQHSPDLLTTEATNCHTFNLFISTSPCFVLFESAPPNLRYERVP